MTSAEEASRHRDAVWERMRNLLKESGVYADHSRAVVDSVIYGRPDYSLPPVHPPEMYRPSGLNLHLLGEQSPSDTATAIMLRQRATEDSMHAYRMGLHRWKNRQLSRALERLAGIPRGKPITDDAVQMLDDLRRHGGATPEILIAIDWAKPGSDTTAYWSVKP